MKLSPHFELNEFINSQTATRFGIDNTPPKAAFENLKRLAVTLEEVRALYNRPIRISSGYRSPELNRRVGGSPTSQHTKGCAVDFTVQGIAIRDVIEDIMESDIEYDQLISEFDNGKGGGWVHLSIPEGDVYRKQALIIDKFGMKEFA